MTDDASTLLQDQGSIEPGEYDCDWTINNNVVRGHVELRAGRPPVGYARTEIHDGSVPGQPGHYAWSYPSTIETPVVRGYIESRRRHVVFLDARLTAVFSERTQIAGTIALVSRARLPDDLTFTRMTMQVTKIHEFCGLPPLNSNVINRRSRPPYEFGAETTELKREWDSAGMRATFYYAYRASVDPFILSVVFSPWIEFITSSPMDAGTWLQGWCLPLVELISVSTGEKEQCTHVTLRSDDERDVKAAVFSSPVSQEPFSCGRKSSDILAFTANGEEFSLVRALAAWSDLRSAGHPLVVGYNTIALGSEQHPQARILLLLQWLEASYGFDRRDEYVAKQEKHKATRDSLLAKLQALKESGQLDTQEMRLARRVPRRAEPTLAEALAHYFAAHHGLATGTALAELELIVAEMDRGQPTIIDALRNIRNGLSHGTAAYSPYQLLDIVEVLHPLVRAEYLRLLGGSFDTDSLIC